MLYEALILVHEARCQYLNDIGDDSFDGHPSNESSLLVNGSYGFPPEEFYDSLPPCLFTVCIYTPPFFHFLYFSFRLCRKVVYNLASCKSAEVTDANSVS